MKAKWWLISLLVCLAVASLAPLASSSPDGLERVAQDKGFIDRAQEPPFHAISDYLFPGIENEALATIVAGLVGTLILFGIAYGVAWALTHNRRESVMRTKGAQQ